MDQYKETDPVKILFGSEEILQSAILLLKHPDKLKEEQLIVEGLKACDVLSLTQSGDLVTKLFTEISK